MTQELPEPLQMAVVDLAEWLVSQKLNVGTCHGAEVAMQRLADERPHMAQFITDLSPDQFLSVLERADQYRQIISAIQGVQ